MKQHPIGNQRQLAKLIALLITLPINAWADNGWNYQQKNDSLSNETYSLAQSPLPRPGLYDDMMLSIVCREGKLQAVIETEDLIASQGSRFEVEYQIDKQAPVKLPMKTYPDSKRKGYTDEVAKYMAEDLVKGEAVFIKVNTMLRTVLSSSIPLENSALPIQKVLADCGFGENSQKASYSLSEFEQEFAKLSAGQQQQVLIKVRQIVLEMK